MKGMDTKQAKNYQITKSYERNKWGDKAECEQEGYHFRQKAQRGPEETPGG